MSQSASASVCSLHNRGKCTNSDCKNSHEPDKFSIQLVPGGPNICRSFFLYHMSCENIACPYSHDLEAAGMPMNNAAIFPFILSEFRMSHGAMEFSKARMEALLKVEPKKPEQMNKNDILRELMRRDKKAVIFSPMGPVICKGHLLDPKGCIAKGYCPYSHDLSPLKLAARSRINLLGFFDQIDDYCKKGKKMVSQKVFNREFIALDSSQHHDFNGLNGSQILEKINSSLLLDLRKSLPSKEAEKEKTQIPDQEPSNSPDPAQIGDNDIKANAHDQPPLNTPLHRSNFINGTDDEKSSSANRLAAVAQIPGLMDTIIYDHKRAKSENDARLAEQRRRTKEYFSKYQETYGKQDPVFRRSTNSNTRNSTYGATSSVQTAFTNGESEGSSSRTVYGPSFIRGSGSGKGTETKSRVQERQIQPFLYKNSEAVGTSLLELEVENARTALWSKDEVMGVGEKDERYSKQLAVLHEGGAGAANIFDTTLHKESAIDDEYGQTHNMGPYNEVSNAEICEMLLTYLDIPPRAPEEQVGRFCGYCGAERKGGHRCER